MRLTAKIFNKFFLIAAVLLTTACNAGDDMILEYKDVQSFQATVIFDRTPLALKISGLAFHSAMSVEKITTKIEGPLLTIYVHLTVAKSGLSGRFEYELSVPDSVNEVRFGKEKFVIWKRKTMP